MRKFLFPLLAVAAAFPVAAAEVDYSYASEPYDFIGTAKMENYDVAVFLPGAAFKDNRIKRISVPLVKTNASKFDRDTVSVWLSNALTLEKVGSQKVNVPDIASYDVVRTEDNGMLEFSLPEEYVVLEEGVYVGYSFSMKVIDSNSTKYPIAVGNGGTNPDGFFLHTSRTYVNWGNNSDKFGCCSRLTVGLEGDFADVSVTPLSFPKSIYAKVGEPSAFECSFITSGTEDITSLDIDYEMAGATASAHVELMEAVAAGLNKRFSAIVEFPVFEAAFSEKARFTVAKVNGKENHVASTVESMVTAYTSSPARTPMLEEYTGLGCGNCPRGFASLEYIKENYPEFVTVAYHARSYNDPMDCILSGNYPSEVSGYPSAWLDRTYPGDPYFGTYSTDNSYNMADEMVAESETFTPWSVSLSSSWEDDDTLVANVQVSSIERVDSGDYRIGWLLVENGMSDPAWIQANYFAGSTASYFNIPQMEQFINGGSYVSGLVFNDVVVDARACHGVEGSIPADLANGETVEGSRTFRMADVVNYLGESLVRNKDEMYVVAFVVDGEGKVMNCAKTKTRREEAAVQGVSADDNGAPVEYYDLSGRRVYDPASGLFIRRQGADTSKIIL